MSDNFCKRDSEKVLLVEGQNDCHVIIALCGLHKVPETFGIYDCGSDTQALKRLNALIQSSVKKSVIGLVMDADSPNLSGRWASIESKLSTHGYSLPKVPSVKGTIIDSINGLPRIGIWLMPNNENDGMLEDFCREMIDKSAWQTIDKCIDIAIEEGCASFKSVHRSKAFMHTYLAWQDEPGYPLGLSITRTVLSGTTSTALTFTEWLTELFG